MFLTEQEAIFFFEGADVLQSVEGIARNPGTWRAGAAWKECLAGKPRIGEEGYSWGQGRPPA